MKVALFEPERTQPTSVSGLQAVVPHSIIERPLSAHLHHCIERADYGDATVFTINPHANIPMHAGPRIARSSSAQQKGI